MKTVEQKLNEVDTRLRRWKPRLTRASNEVAKLLKQRWRLLAQVEKPKVNAFGNFEPKPSKRTFDPLEQPNPVPFPHGSAGERPAVVLDIPAELRRDDAEPSRSLAETIDPQKVADLLDPAGAMNRKRLQRLDAKRRGYKLPTVDKTAMPLTGKAALAHIKKAKQK